MIVDNKWPYSEQEWADISEQYGELSKDGNVTQIFNLKKDIAVLYNKCRIAEEVINSLDLADNKDLWGVLKRLGIMSNDLNVCKAQAKRFAHDLAERQKDLAKFVTDKKTTHADFDEKLVILGKFLGYRIVQTETTIAEYCAINNRYNAENEALQRQIEKSNGRGLNK